MRDSAEFRSDWLSGVLCHERDTENKVCLSQTHDDDIPKLKRLREV